MKDLKPGTFSEDASEYKTGVTNDLNSYPYLVNHDSEWEKYFNTIIIQDGVENLHIHYKGITYKFNLQKVLDKLADVVESIEVVNNKE